MFAGGTGSGSGSGTGDGAGILVALEADNRLVFKES